MSFCRLKAIPDGSKRTENDPMPLSCRQGAGRTGKRDDRIGVQKNVRKTIDSTIYGKMADLNP